MGSSSFVIVFVLNLSESYQSEHVLSNLNSFFENGRRKIRGTKRNNEKKKEKDVLDVGVMCESKIFVSFFWFRVRVTERENGARHKKGARHTGARQKERETGCATEKGARQRKRVRDREKRVRDRKGVRDTEKGCEIDLWKRLSLNGCETV